MMMKLVVLLASMALAQAGTNQTLAPTEDVIRPDPPTATPGVPTASTPFPTFPVPVPTPNPTPGTTPEPTVETSRAAAQQRPTTDEPSRWTEPSGCDEGAVSTSEIPGEPPSRHDCRAGRVGKSTRAGSAG
ncbi:hypothetical protein THAOC_03494 [Thalassiosira oceanica]|uniref:Uncharacterized protein n=1 Tax=Thalassiosira oceanica TaxID=159749 RepID=K0TKW1_THAOC|nr:hypothetical protein THAOC_03494 [Thalassiosira oceanica]|eukprot:EJK74806.1 hypothetical protein THAOC_03494 [Thalassiosira oceanica]